jgi:hypothetical protein
MKLTEFEESKEYDNRKPRSAPAPAKSKMTTPPKTTKSACKFSFPILCSRCLGSAEIIDLENE